MTSFHEIKKKKKKVKSFSYIVFIDYSKGVIEAGLPILP